MKKNDIQINFSFKTFGVTTAGGEMSPPLDAEEFFPRLKSAYLEWRRPLPAMRHSLSLTVPLPSKVAAAKNADKAAATKPSQVNLIQRVCQLWNADSDIANVGESHVELMFIRRSLPWKLCTTAERPLLKNSATQGLMRLFDHTELVKEAEAIIEQSKKSARAQRLANPVRHPVELPKTIRAQIAAYLRREFGESAKDKGSLKARDLQFNGEYDIDGVPTQFWRYPNSKPSWASVERFDDHYELGIAMTAPPQDKLKS
jgi:hypothetical protein